MISETVTQPALPKNGSLGNSQLPLCVVYGPTVNRQPGRVITTKELLGRLRDKGVKNVEIARTLGITASRVTELYDGMRALKLDEAAKLVDAFDLEDEQSSSRRVSPLPPPVSRLVVQHIAAELGRPLEEESQQLADLGEDLRAFAEFVTDPKVRESIELAATFFQALRLRRPEPARAS